MSGRTTDMGAARAFFDWAMTLDTDECIEWPYSSGNKGYGQLRWEGRVRNVHRLACEIAHGPCPPGMETAHGPCNNRKCFNPKHLSWKTPPANSHDRVRDGTNNGNSTLRPRDVRVIRWLYGEGEMTQMQLAEQYGVSYPTINAIITKRKWKSVED